MTTVVDTPVDVSFRFVDTESVNESPMNPRKYFNPERLAELENSIRQKGVLTPLLVRPHPAIKGEYEIAAGHRRYRAANAVGLGQLPVLVREMDDASFLEVLVIENDQRDDVHPLEEAGGYKALMLTAHFTVERLAERVGRSTKYIYDRIKLLELTEQAQELFMAGRITAGHAILLARLSPDDQARAIGTEGDYADGWLFVESATLFDALDQTGAEEPADPFALRRPVSVRELQAAIDKHVRFEALAPDPMLFPDTVKAVEEAVAEREKVVHITWLRNIPEEAKGEGQRTFLPGAWKRADGESKETPPCDYSATGVIVVGPGRGEAFKVCTAKKKCAVHWADEQRAAAQVARNYSGASGDPQGDAQRENRADQQRKLQQQQDREEATRKRWEKARPEILKATAARLKTLPVHPNSALGELVLRAGAPHGGAKGLSAYLAIGRTAEDLVRFVAFLLLYRQLVQWDAPTAFAKAVKPLGIDVEDVLGGETPEGKAPAAKAPTARKAAPKKAQAKKAKKSGR